MLTDPNRPRPSVPPPGRSLDEVVVDCALYEEGQRIAEHVPLPDALRLSKESPGFVWIGLVSPSAEQFSEIASAFELPALAVEDAVSAHQRPKLERYGEVTFLVVKPIRYVDSDELVETSELAVFLGPEYVITVRHGASDVPARVRTQLEDDPGLLSQGPGAVVYRLLDEVVDGYVSVALEVERDVEEIEAQVFGGNEDDHSQRIYSLKREVLEFRRAVLPLAPPLLHLLQEDVPGLHGDTRPFLRDVHDHVVRTAEAIESYDRLLTDVLQAHLAQVGVRQNRTAVKQNEDMRKISAWAAIALVPTAVAGVYGMNFEHMPELAWRYGYFAVLAFILAACTGLYFLFRRNGWL